MAKRKNIIAIISIVVAIITAITLILVFGCQRNPENGKKSTQKAYRKNNREHNRTGCPFCPCNAFYKRREDVYTA